MYCDLHAHTIYSDGTVTPTELVAIAKQSGLGAVALTDHNSVGGIKEFMAAARDSGVIGIPGIEFSTDYKGNELHVVGLFVDESSYGRITELTDLYKRRKEQSNRDLVQKLRERGYDIDYDEIKAGSKDSINRSNIGAALYEKGYVESITKAFTTLLNPECGLYKRPQLVPTTEIIRELRGLGILPVLAHPFLTFNEAELRDCLPEFVQSGLQAMEVHYVLYDEETTGISAKLCAEFGLAESGGSDFHGAAKPNISLGTGKGNLKIGMDIYENLAALHQATKNDRKVSG